MKRLKICIIIGARPQYIKSAMLMQAIEKHNQNQDQEIQIEPYVVHTGQHYDYNMFMSFFDQFQVRKPDIDLGISGGSHGKMVGKMMIAIESGLKMYTPDYVLVFGDTNSALAGALAAAKLQIPIIHVEAGLRCHNKRVPEEINRLIIDHVSDLLFCYGTEASLELEHEGIIDGVYTVGDITYDAFLKYNIAKSLRKLPEKYYLATIHREENVSDSYNLSSILLAIDCGVGGVPVIMPIHPNTKNKLKANNLVQYDNIEFIDPVSYFEMLALEKGASAIITDSGGVQKEAFWFGVPCITLRNETEETDTTWYGGNVLVGSDSIHIMEAIQNANPININKKTLSDIYGDGTVAKQIIERIIQCDLD